MILSLEKMNIKARGVEVLLLAFFVLVLFSSSLVAAPSRGQYYQDPNAIAIKEMYSVIEDIRHEVNNHETEIRMYDEKLKNFDSIIESVRDQVIDSSKFYKDQFKNNFSNLEAKLISLENLSKGLIGDIRLFKTHANETDAILNQFKQKIGEMEKVIDLQNQDIEHLQAAMRSLMEALQGKVQNSKPERTVINQSKSEAADLSNSDRSYKVKAGDSLEKIARSHQTTIQAIKDANGLTTDRIVVGKTLIIPEK